MSQIPLPQRHGELARPGPRNLLAALSWILLVAVIFGGYSLLRMLASTDELSPFQERFFRAGHAHAGVLTAVGLLYSNSLNHTTLTYRKQVWAWLVYALGVGCVSGGFFLHMAIGKEGAASAGTALTTAGAVVIVAMALYLAWHLFRARNIADHSVSTSHQTGDSR
ncbi:MAG: hypothetical protein WBA63_06660 [Thermomicrobiales bacterium]